MKNIFLFGIALLLLSACSKFPGYKKLTPEIYYSLFQFGNENKDKKVLAGDYITILIQYRTMADSVFFSGERKVKVNTPKDDASVDNCFLNLNLGDSAGFILNGAKFFNHTLKRSIPSFISESEFIKINILLIDIQSEKEFQTEKELFLSWATEFSDYENKILQQFLREEEPGIQKKPEGFYMLTMKEGKGPRIKNGDHIWVHYEGKFINGKFFDGTYRSHQAIDFIYGTKFYLVAGLNIALSYMSEGEIALVVLPSDLAFGSRGDDFGIIPPYTSLIYTLELVKIE